MANSGLFISFEGIDGSGKSTQMGLLAETLRGLGHTVVETRNPGGTPLGIEIRQMLLHSKEAVSPTCEMLLFMADRAQQMDELILPALAQGHIVLCDRHIDSTVAYQGYGRGLPLETIHQMNAVATRGNKPHLTLLFDGPAEVLLERAGKRSEADRLEQAGVAFFERTAEGYRQLAAGEPNRIKTLDATLPPEQLQTRVMELVGCHLHPATLF